MRLDDAYSLLLSLQTVVCICGILPPCKECTSGEDEMAGQADYNGDTGKVCEDKFEVMKRRVASGEIP